MRCTPDPEPNMRKAVQGIREVALFFFFFFKQKTAYEIRKGDWSSDVCSSDLSAAVRYIAADPCDRDHRTRRYRRADHCDANWHSRSEERRVGKECPSLCRS